MSSEDISRKLTLVCNLIYQVNGTLPQNIKADDSLINDLAMDSVEMIDLLMHLEEYGVVLEDSQLSNALTVGQIAQLMPD
ncbi:acyl carrier protein [Vagococcus sp. WN89Y]|uniref:acyl carrier protein n=1 Tax=Vagococcus sp. WN89Y TaxID=3457258 RepID=UPI003FCD6773